jgi:hypothetical protein
MNYLIGVVSAHVIGFVFNHHFDFDLVFQLKFSKHPISYRLIRILLF